MSGRSCTRRIAYLCWALLLVAGLSFNTAQAEAVHGSCGDICVSECGEGKCRRAIDMGCTCFYRCTNGGSGTAICVV